MKKWILGILGGLLIPAGIIAALVYYPAIAGSIFLVLGYFAPSLIARARKHPQIFPIEIINIFLGWTFIGWVISLAWASQKIDKK